jgi:broad specificity phosphatase PhoE
MADVSIVDFAFQPMAIFVGVGETVEWTNTGNADHTVDSDTEIFESDILDPGETYRYTFDVAFTSALSRAQETLRLMLEEIGRPTLVDVLAPIVAREPAMAAS